MKISTIHSLSKEECERLLLELNAQKTNIEYKLAMMRLRYSKRLISGPQLDQSIRDIISELESLEQEAEQPPDLVPDSRIEISIIRLRRKHQRLVKKVEKSSGSNMVILEYDIWKLQSDLDTIDAFIEMIKNQWRILVQN